LSDGAFLVYPHKTASVEWGFSIMYDYQQEPDLDSIPTMDAYFDRVDDAWFHSVEDRYQNS